MLLTFRSAASDDANSAELTESKIADVVTLERTYTSTAYSYAHTSLPPSESIRPLPRFLLRTRISLFGTQQGRLPATLFCSDASKASSSDSRLLPRLASGVSETGRRSDASSVHETTKDTTSWEGGGTAGGDGGDGGSCGGGGGDGAYTASETTSLTPSGSYTTAQPQTIVCISVP